MSPPLAELCTLLVGNAFGDLAARIFSTLAEHGRMHLPALRRISAIPIRRLKVGLTTLIQHHIVLYYAEDEDAPTFFQLDWTAAYSLVRCHKLLHAIEEREGVIAKGLVANVLHLGHTSVGDLAEEYGLLPTSKRDSGIDNGEERVTENGMVNGITENGVADYPMEHKITLADFHTTLRRLLSQGILVKVNERTFVPYADLQEEIKETVIAEDFPDGKITGSKKSKEFQEKVNTLKRKYQDDDAYSDTRDIGSHGDIMRSDTAEPKNKRLKPNHLSNGTHHHVGVGENKVEAINGSFDKLPNDMVVRVNFEKVTVLIRNRRFAQMATSSLGPVTGAVYAALLRALEDHAVALRRDPKIYQDKNEDDDEEDDDDDDDTDPLPAITDIEVEKYLDPSIEPADDDGPPPNLPNGNGGDHDHSHSNAVDGTANPVLAAIEQEHFSDSEEDEGPGMINLFNRRKKRLALIDTHLEILSEHDKAFCMRSPASARSPAKTYVDFSLIGDSLVVDNIDAMVLARYGHIAHRTVRIIRQFEKLDEKPISQMSQQPFQTACALLTKLSYNGIVESQELPKDNRRVPNSALYLYWIDDDRIRCNQLVRAYQGMARCLQRLKSVREGRFRGVIEKAAHIGISTDEEIAESALLSSTDKEELKKWREMEETLLVQVDRLDDMVGVYRDFSGMDASLMMM